jgi:SAM-dependent methyltransferase
MPINAYDELEYVSRPFRQTHPDRMASLAMLFGLTPPDPASARVLDIGCGEGGNIIPMALTMPGATFHGFDLARTAVEKAKARIGALGLANIRVEHLDLMDFPEDAGDYDYIVAQGFYSWIPDVVRERYLQLLARHLSPNGIAYVSFNAYPGAMFRHAWRDGAAFHTGVLGCTDAQERVVESCNMLQLMATARSTPDTWSAIAGEMVRAVQTKGMNWVSHDDFGPFFKPFYFHQVAETAAAYGLQYLSDAVYYDMQPHNLTPGAQGILAQLADTSVLLREQYYDFIEMRPFRQILLCRSDVTPQRPERPEALRRMHFSSPAETTKVASDGSYTVHNSLTGITVELPGPLRNILEQLRLAWPNTLPFAAIALAETDRAKIAGALLQLYGAALLEAHASPVACGSGTDEHPVAWRLARLEAETSNAVTTRLHTQVQLDDASARLVRRLDGSASRAQLAAEFDDLDGRLNYLANFGLLEPHS